MRVCAVTILRKDTQEQEADRLCSWWGWGASSQLPSCLALRIPPPFLPTIYYRPLVSFCSHGKNVAAILLTNTPVWTESRKKPEEKKRKPGPAKCLLKAWKLTQCAGQLVYQATAVLQSLCCPEPRFSTLWLLLSIYIPPLFTTISCLFLLCLITF